MDRFVDGRPLYARVDCSATLSARTLAVYEHRIATLLASVINILAPVPSGWRRLSFGGCTGMSRLLWANSAEGGSREWSVTRPGTCPHAPRARPHGTSRGSAERLLWVVIFDSVLKPNPES